MLGNFIEKIKATKKLANEKNIHNWYNCVFHSIIIIFGASLILSLYTLVYLSDISLDTTLGDLIINLQPGIFLPVLYSIVLSYLFLEKLVILHIHIFEKLNKLIFKAWHKLDMYWFKKYKKSSPLTEGMAKIQGKVSKYQNKSSKRTRKLIAIALIGLLILLQVGLRAEQIQETLTEEEIDQSEEELQIPDQQEQKVRVNVGR